MTRPYILFADNDKDFLDTRRKILEQEGYRVIEACSPEEAAAILDRARLDAALLDLRLRDDDDEKDTSGLDLAKRCAPAVPKIIMTKFPTIQAVREALGPQLDRLPTAVDFIAKQDGAQAMLTAVRKAVRLEKRLKELIDNTTNRLSQDHENARQQAQTYFWGAMSAGIASIVLILVGAGLALSGLREIGLIGALSGLLSDAVAFLFFRRSDASNQRMDRYHQELLQTRQFETLLAACEEIDAPQQKDVCRQRVIKTAMERWFGDPTASAALPRPSKPASEGSAV